VAIAYQVLGEAERDLVPDFVSNLVFDWQSRYFREFYERLARSFRLIWFDKRGHARTVFRRALEHENLLLAEAPARMPTGSPEKNRRVRLASRKADECPRRSG
jgi:hypothetical protein